MNPLEAVVKCRYDKARMQWLYSLPDRKDANATYEHHYQCPFCGSKKIVRSETIRWRDEDQAMDYGALG